MRRGSFGERLSLSIREVVFGLEDSLVSTLGAVTGIAVGTGDRFVVVLGGVVVVVVEVVSMAAGSYLSSKSATELLIERERQDKSRVLGERISDRETLRDLFVRKGMSKADVAIAVEAIGRERSLWMREVKRCEMRHLPGVGASPLFSAVVMGVFYAIGGIVVLLPYLVLPVGPAIPAACVVAFVALFTVGFIKGKVIGTPAVKSGFEMLIVSFSAALLGFFFGRLVPAFFGLEAVY